MRIGVTGTEILFGTGGKPVNARLPAILFLHGVGYDHTVWQLLARWFAHRGSTALAPDFPGHGLSGGEPLRSISALADWTIAFLDAVDTRQVAIVGHSMGSLIALEIAARYPERVRALALICPAAVMRVSPQLLNAAEANSHAAIDMINLWGHGRRASVGGSLAPGMWMTGGAERLLHRAAPSVIHTDLAACNDYRDGLAHAATVKAPTTVVLGERDMMTPAKSGRELAAALPQSRVVEIRGAGHMLMSERPDEVLAAIRHFAPR
jgi:pimeloyl-ACP methyl ester carboxylesterase